MGSNFYLLHNTIRLINQTIFILQGSTTDKIWSAFIIYLYYLSYEWENKSTFAFFVPQGKNSYCLFLFTFIFIVQLLLVRSSLYLWPVLAWLYLFFQVLLSMNDLQLKEQSLNHAWTLIMRPVDNYW